MRGIWGELTETDGSPSFRKEPISKRIYPDARVDQAPAHPLAGMHGGATRCPDTGRSTGAIARTAETENGAGRRFAVGFFTRW